MSALLPKAGQALITLIELIYFGLGTSECLRQHGMSELPPKSGTDRCWLFIELIYFGFKRKRMLAPAG